MKKELALFGYGRFGRFAAHYLKRHFRVYVVDQRKNIRLEQGLHRATFVEAAAKDFIVLAVPINKLPALLKQIAPVVKPGAIVCDVCSVKEQPIAWMKQILPKNISILGTHPLFGPDSASNGIRGKHLILSPVRVEKRMLQSIIVQSKRDELIIHTMTPRAHDKLMASTLFLTQYLGHALHRLPLLSSDITTQNFQFLQHVASTTGNDTLELFHDMYRYNQFARRIPSSVMKRFYKLADSLVNKRS